MDFSRVSSDALPALSGKRCIGTVQSGRISGKQGGTAEIVFLSLFPSGNKDFFYGKGVDCYDEKAARQTMAFPTRSSICLPCMIKKEN